VDTTPQLTALSASEIVLHGDLTFQTVKQLGLLPEDIIGKAQHSLQLDLSELQAIDSAGVALLLEWLKQCDAKQCKLRLSQISTQLTRFIELYELDALFEIESSSTRADAQLTL
jgi:phospholipid transport system transporter-binding protein